MIKGEIRITLPTGIRETSFNVRLVLIHVTCDAVGFLIKTSVLTVPVTMRLCVYYHQTLHKNYDKKRLYYITIKPPTYT